MFGVASVFASLAIIGIAIANPTSWRSAVLISLSVITVSFSKGPFLLGPLCVILGLTSLRLSERWRLAASALATVLGVVVFFRFASYAASPLRLEFWAPQNMSGHFKWSLYSFKIFSNTVLAPVAAGVASALVCIHSRVSQLKQWVVALSIALITGMLTLLFITSDDTEGFGYFYFSAAVATATLLLMSTLLGDVGPALSRGALFRALLTSLGITVILNLVFSKPPSPAITPLSIGAALAVLVISAELGTRRLRLPIRSHFRAYAVVVAVALSPLGVVYGQIHRNLSELRDISSLRADRNWSNWYGDTEMKEVMDFLSRNTMDSDLLAVNSCPLSLQIGDGCEPDYRLAAITGRRFFSMDARFAEAWVDNQTWRDYELSSSIGTKPPSETIDELTNRGVTHLVLLKARAPLSWQREVLDLSIEKLLENQSYLVLKL